MEHIRLSSLQGVADRAVDFLNSFSAFRQLVGYVEHSLATDPWRLFLEFVVLVILLNYLFRKGSKPKQGGAKPLTTKEKDQIISEWDPEPLVPPPTAEIERINKNMVVLEGPPGTNVTVAGRSVLNLASFNFLGLNNDPAAISLATSTLRRYGVGSCGPPGFYGTLDVHTDLEHAVSEFLGTEESILYSFGFAAVASAIPAYAKKGDVIVADEAVSFALQRGIDVSRANAHFFKHNDMADLERVLEGIDKEHKKSKRALPRRFLIVEGLYANNGDIAPLKQLVELKNKYKYRLVVDESMSFGVLGKTGRGATEHAGVPVSEVDLIIASLANAIGGAGGFCSGTSFVIDHQRLSGQGYTFSASMPAMLTVTCSHGLKVLGSEPARVERLAANARYLRGLLKDVAGVHVGGAEESPVLHVGLANPTGTRDEQEDALQQVVNDALAQGVLLTRAHYVLQDEMRPVKPSIRISVSQAHTKEELKKAADVLKAALKKNNIK